MRTWKKSAAVAVAAVALLATSASAWSHDGWRYRGRSSVHLGFSFGGPIYGPPVWYPAPAYVYPPAVVIPPAPRVYIERDAPVVLHDNAPGYWYYCRESDTYYPYVRDCAGPWERVPARPQ
jgi:hypothetical protein